MLLQTIFFIAAAGLLYFCWCGNSALVAPCLRNSRELLVRLYNVRATHARAHVFTTNGVINQKCLHCTHTHTHARLTAMLLSAHDLPHQLAGVIFQRKCLHAFVAAALPLPLMLHATCVVCALILRVVVSAICDCKPLTASSFSLRYLICHCS